MRIDVTAEDIAKGVPGSECNCPIALAVKRVKPSYFNVVVSGYLIEAGADTFSLPAKARDFIRRFDMGYGEISPFSFEV